LILIDGTYGCVRRTGMNGDQDIGAEIMEEAGLKRLSFERH
jgi:hypothetical protein